MKRLLEQNPDGAAEERLTELVRHSAPFSVNPFRKRQVWVHLLSMRERARRRRWSLWCLGALALLGSGTAAASLGFGWIGSQQPLPDAPSAQPPAPREAPPAPPKHREGMSDADSASDTDQHTDEPATEPEPSTDPHGAPPRRTTVSQAASEDSSRSLPAAKPADGEELSHVVTAIRAWRSDRNAAKARTLLHTYLKEHPQGSLAEDALALLIEIAAAQQDPRAASYAKRYLKAYPQGRFRSLAEQVMDVAR